ncbi:mechanosensitive ion channel family protein [Aquabacter spiritensis]|uniref:Small conductance mechanosensitive channel n=1 Tax=Aquabacter spiritensis TaxID=933073 RepID=A0A4R3LYY4_9HYPH|nr:mechanosensitive ion channel domain-containing protein [Aquabacter spiritensis]TCT03937.1 small conductance mechanosensitive channel [Aquabacter spiritensis]
MRSPRVPVFALSFLLAVLVALGGSLAPLTVSAQTDPAATAPVPAAPSEGAPTPSVPSAPPQTATPVAPPPSAPPPAALAEPERRSVERLLGTLADEGARTRLMDDLRSLLRVAPGGEPAPEARNDWLADVTQSLGALSAGVLAMVGEIERLPEQIEYATASLSDPLTLERIARTVFTVAAVLLGALAAEWLVKFLLRRPREAVERRVVRFWPLRLLLVIVRILLDVLPIAAFAAAAFGVLALALVDMGFVVRLAVVTVINANVLARIVIAGGRALLAPSTPGLRLLPLTDESAAYSFLWLKRFTNTGIYGYFLLRTFWIIGLSQAAYLFLGDLLALLLAGMAIVFVFQVRRPVAHALRGRDGAPGNFSRFRRHAADFWHILALGYIVAAYLVWVLDMPGGFAYLARATLLSIVTIGVLRLVLHGLDRVFAAIFRLGPETVVEHPLLEERANRYLPALRRVCQAVLVLVAALVIVEVWGGAPFEWFASERGQGVLGRVVSISIVVLIGVFVWEIASAFAERTARRRPDSTRLKTLLPFMQNALRIVLLTIAGLIVLSELGVNIAPLLAGAGVLGLAIGFGAQTLVKDVITGIFILLEDTVSVGDVVELGSHGGLVEKISIRTVHLRDFDGNVHSIPFSEVQTIKNMSKHFAFAVVDVRVAYRENIDDALALMAEVAADMATKGPLAATIVEPFEVVGVEALEDSGVWLRGRFKTRPLGQWNVKREFYRRIKGAFDARGIEIPFPHTTLYFGTDKKGNAPPVRVLSNDAAAAEAPTPSRRRAALDAAARAPGPMIEEHPGAREREDDTSLIPAVDEQTPR